MSALQFLLLLLCLSFSPSSSLSLSESEALLAFKKSQSNASLTLPNWKPNSHPCRDKWQGVFCGKGRDGNPIVIRLHLQNMGLSGLIDMDALSELKALISLSISNNSFEGALPPFNKLKHLKALYIDSNKFSEEIPGDYFDGTSFRRIWFSNNQFSGKIPYSLERLSTLNFLHLENNKFSGSIPNLSQKSLTELDLSGNQLEGKVPQSMQRFGPKAFKGNPTVCGKFVGVECKEIEKKATIPSNTAELQPPSAQASHAKATLVLVVALVFIMIILLVVSIQMKQQDGYDRYIENGIREGGKNRGHDMVQVCVQKNNASSRRDGGSSKTSTKSWHKKGSESENGSRGGLRNSKKDVEDMIMMNNEKGVFGLADLMKAPAEVLGNTGLGSAYKTLMPNGMSMVVKRIRDMNGLGKEEFHTEIRRLSKLAHKNILTPLAYHYRKEEKLLVSEFISKGSLLYVLHGDRGSSHSELNWPTRLNIIKGIARGMSYLHNQLPSDTLPHGNLKSSNVLLKGNCEPLLCDYGFCRMFNPAQAAEGMFAYKAPEVAERKQVSSKCDVYCLGIIILEVLTGKFPSQYHNVGEGGTDVVQWVRSSIDEEKETGILDPGIASSVDSLRSMIRLLHIGAACCDTNPDKRPGLEEVIRTIEDTEV